MPEDQLQLTLDVVAPFMMTGPRCGLCARPARWMPRAGTWSRYCGRNGCDNPERICQNGKCGKPFLHSINGAGTKYCSVACRNARHESGGATAQCAWCEKFSRGSRGERTGGWPYVCGECTAPLRHVIGRLRKHHVPIERARKLLVQPYCDLYPACQRNIIDVVAFDRGHYGALLAVDHDHRCCPGDISCGRCVRALLCGPHNAALGMLGDDPDAALAASELLRAHRERFTP